MFNIRRPLLHEIKDLYPLPPEEWNLDLPSLVSLHFEHPYFYPVIAEIENKIAGFGNGILNGNVGWIGNIIVSPEFRNRGLGYGITDYLVKCFIDKGCSTQLLIASDMGKNIYTKIGFSVTSSYLFYKRTINSSNYQPSNNIKKIKSENLHQIMELDKKVSGEERFHLIERFVSTGFVYSETTSTEIKGFYLPDLGGGLIIANDNKAGIEFMKLRASQGKETFVIPSQNNIAIDFLNKEGFQPFRELPRMILGKELNWKPECVFNRGAGYCG